MTQFSFKYSLSCLNVEPLLQKLEIITPVVLLNMMLTHKQSRSLLLKMADAASPDAESLGAQQSRVKS